MEEILFMPLGGGQRVGASCYFLKIGDANIILDAGIGKENGIDFGPDFHSLITSPYIQSMGQINQIYISHAHSDHIGCLMSLMTSASHANVYMTGVTKTLTQFQVYDRVFSCDSNHNENERLATQSLLEKIIEVNYMQTLDFGKFKATFYQAGHIPGAMMVLFDTGKKKILYTGDYSLESTLLTGGCLLPSDIAVDTVILCGLHAKHPTYTKKTNALIKLVRDILARVTQCHQSVLCYVPQLSKGLELIKALNEWNTTDVPIYLDESVLKIVEKMEQLMIPIVTQNNKVKGTEIPNMPHVYVTSRKSLEWSPHYAVVTADFSLHEDFPEMKRFLRKINPRQAFVVHCGKAYNPLDATIEQEMMNDVDSRTQFIFPEEKEIYKL